MRILIIGGTGKVGCRLVEKLRQHSITLRVLTRDAERAASLLGDVECVAADITGNPGESEVSFQDVDAVFMLNRPTFAETAEGLLAVELARKAGVRRFVYQSVFDGASLAHLPHVAPKIAIQNAVMQAGMEWTVICPNHFYQNDHLVRFSLAERSVYDLPIGKVGCSSVDADDIAEAAARVLTQDGHGGKSYPLVGPQVLTGDDCAGEWSTILGRPVHYDGDIERWRAGLPAAMLPWFTYDLAMMYRVFQRNGFAASERDVAAVTVLLGREPTSYSDFVARQAQEWGFTGDPAQTPLDP